MDPGSEIVAGLGAVYLVFLLGMSIGALANLYYVLLDFIAPQYQLIMMVKNMVTAHG